MQFCSDGMRLPLLGRAERSTPKARRVAPEGAKGLTANARAERQ